MVNEEMKKKKCHNYHLLISICYFGLYLVFGLSLLIKQPFGNPPDEYNRFLIPQYIAENGTLPNGYDESIRIGGYGFSYGFQPILPYMFQGYAMRFMGLFTDSEKALLYTARGVNLFLGLCTAWFVLQLSRKWFSDRRFSWLFAFLATFLPQSIFVHTYVNTDSCCMFSIAVMLYGLTGGLESRFAPRDSLLLAAGIILCALSYYNAYGYILSCILIFSVFFLSRSSSGKLQYDVGDFLKKGIFISAVVLLGIGWWFIRSAILYDGDFLGLQARHECALLYAIPEFHPDTRITWQNQGYSLLEMMKESDFWTLSVLSFIGVYGPMTITTSLWVYRFYKAMFLLGFLLCVVIPLSKTRMINGYGVFYETSAFDEKHTFRELLYGSNKAFRIFYHLNMLFCIVMPLFLSLIYSYATDYQPQGRYLLPALLPVCYYTIHGLEKAWNLQIAAPYTKSRILTCLAALLCTCMAGLLALTIYGYAFPYYEANPIAP